MHQRIVTVVGGTGFVGQYVVKLLAKAGYTIRVISRNPNRASYLKTSGDVGQVVLVKGNLANLDAHHIDGSYAVINLVGILFEAGKQNFSALHAQGAEKLAKLAKQAGVKRFIHMSSLGVDKATKSKYARTKALGEKAVVAAFAEATILRPSVIFGAEDNFFNQFASLARFLPVLPLIGGGNTLFQPVYVGDVAEAVIKTLEDETTKGKTYELGGPEVLSMRQILAYTLSVTQRKCLLLNVPFGIASIVSFLAEILPTPPITHDQVRLLHYDNVVAKDAKTFADLGIAPTAVEMVVPEYLARYKK